MKAGFSLVEMTIALAIVLVVAGAVFAVMNPAHGAFHSQPEAIDMEQRLRVSVDAIARDLMMAGAGTRKVLRLSSAAPSRTAGPDPPATFFDDRISILYVPLVARDDSACTDRWRTRVRRSSGRVSRSATLAALTGSWWRFSTRRARTTRSASLRSRPLRRHSFARAGAVETYAPGATVVRVVSATYWMRLDHDRRHVRADEIRRTPNGPADRR